MKINYRYTKYNPPFFTQKKQFKRLKIQMYAWYLLHEYNEDICLDFLAKYISKLKLILDKNFRELKKYANSIYPFENDYSLLRKLILNNGKLCEHCFGPSYKGYKYCSQKCSSTVVNTKRIDYPRGYKLSDETKQKISNSVKFYLNSLSSEQRDYLKISGKPRGPGKLNLNIEGIKLQEYKGTLNTVRVICKKHGDLGYMNYTNVVYSGAKEKICEKCFIDMLKLQRIKDISKVCDKRNIQFVDIVDKYTILLKCKKHGNFTTSLKNFLQHETGCPKCSNNTSKAELEINKIVNGIQNDRTLIKPLEIDVLSTEYKFGIEYDGIMFHSEGIHKSAMFNKLNDLRNNHLHKTELCEEKGYQLFHIFDNEWLNPDKQEIWKSIIRNKMGQNTRIGARKCSVKEVSSKETRKFLNENHLQGYATSSVNIGLYYNNDLIQIMTFSKVQNIYEMVRLCSKINFSVQGGASRLLKHFERNYNPKSLVSYANRRWSEGNLYLKLGFGLNHISSPDYFYFLPNKYILESRNKFQKHKLSKLLEIYDPNLTEVQNMFNNGYRRIWDCGNYVFVKEYTM